MIGRRADIEISLGSVRNPPPNDCSSRMLDCVLEMSTLDFLKRISDSKDLH